MVWNRHKADLWRAAAPTCREAAILRKADLLGTLDVGDRLIVLAEFADRAWNGSGLWTGN
jgi:hypothetical protein